MTGRRNHEAAQKVLEAADLLRQAEVALSAAYRVPTLGDDAAASVLVLLNGVREMRAGCREFGFTFDFEPAS